MVTRTEAIKNFLSRITKPDLAALYNYNMEVQVNVSQDGGERVIGEFQGRPWNGWTDGFQTWKSFRIPRNANSNPEYTDVPMTFSLDHAEGIGMTGWDWHNRLSIWVAFDFDAISGHKDQHSNKLDDAQLAKVREAATMIPWVTVRKSASGNGLHLYVFLHPLIPTQNHNEHAALARAILSKMSAQAGFDFQNKVDICGQNMWAYHRKMIDGDGLSLIKPGQPLGPDFGGGVPQNWHDHIKVVKGYAQKNLPKFLGENVSEASNDIEKSFLELMGQMTRTPLDEEHKRLIKYLEDRGTQSWWDSDHHILITHTFHLKEAHNVLELRGIFNTLSQGTEAPNDHNCFLSPLRSGSWTVRRYSMGCQESPTWDQDGRGYTRCYLNRHPDLPTAARARDGIESPSGGFVFKEAEGAADVARSIGANVPQIPLGLRTQRATLKTHKDGRIVFEIEGDSGGAAAGEMPGWLSDKGKWKRIFNATTLQSLEIEAPSYDDMIRHTITESGEDFGWMLKNSDASWDRKDLAHIRIVLASLSIPRPDIEKILGSCVMKCWKMVSRPFQPEYIGNRLWNRGAAQLKYVPSQEDDLHYDAWDKVLEHCGQHLTPALQNHPWAVANGIQYGSEYLKIWLASLIKNPLEPLPYLFFYGPQDAGKSIFHEAVSLLFYPGYQRADVALVNPQGFNDELRNAVLCVVEEVNLGKNIQAKDRIRDWVTARQISIHKKGKTPYHIANATHWIQCSNDSDACPTFTGDTRITMIFVESLDPAKKIPKRDLLEQLEKQGADFLGALMKLEVPPSNDRLAVPMIATGEKIQVQKNNRDALEAFLDEKCYYIPGAMISIAEFYEAFSRMVDPNELSQWGKKTTMSKLPPQFPRGRSTKDAHHYIGNLSFSESEPAGTKLCSYTDAKNQTWLRPELINTRAGNGNGEK